MELLRSPVVLKSYFVLDTEDGLNNDFKRHAYQQLGKSNWLLHFHIAAAATRFSMERSVHDVKIFSKVDIFKYEKLIGAHHVNRSHWALLVIQPQTQEITYIDPLGDKTAELQKVRRLWNSFARRQFQAGRLLEQKIQLEYPNCTASSTAEGYLVMWSIRYETMFGELILLDKPLSEFCNEQIESHREDMAITLLRHSENIENVCRICGAHSDEDCGFWVQCDMCPKWFHDKCTQMKCLITKDNAEQSHFISACCSGDGQFHFD